MNLKILLILVTFPLYFCQAQNVVHINPDKDNTVIEIPSSLDTNSNGSGPYIFAGRAGASTGYTRRALLHFDIAGNLPANAMIDSVKLRLHSSRSSNSNATTFTLYNLTNNWGEGASTATGSIGAQAQQGDATWVHTYYDNQFWNQTGGDFDTVPIQQFTITDTATYVINGNNMMLTQLQNWYTTPATNYGFILIGDEVTISSARRFDSRENTIAAHRPQLSIWYSTTSHLQTVKSSPFDIYPNPTNHSLTINTQDKEIEKISITDLLGRPHHLTIQKQHTNWILDTSPLIPGNYFIQISTPNSITTQTFLKL